MAFGIWTHCFVKWPLYLLWCTLPFSTFIKYFISFDFSLLQMFGCLLGPRSFDSLEGPLASKKTSLPTTFGNIELILIVTIALIAYLGNWAFVVLVIVSRFVVDQHFFLFEASTEVNNTLPFFSNTISRWNVIFYCPQLAHVFFCLKNSSNNKW